MIRPNGQEDSTSTIRRKQCLSNWDRYSYFSTSSSGSSVSSGMRINSSFMNALFGPRDGTSPDYLDSMRLHSICRYLSNMFYLWLSCAGCLVLFWATASNDTIYPQAVSPLGGTSLPGALLSV